MYVEQILNVSTLIAVTIAFVAVASRGFSAYANIFANRDFKYKFDVSRVPKSLLLALILSVCFFFYSWFIAQDAIVALAYTAIVAFFTMIACVLVVSYKRK